MKSLNKICAIILLCSFTMACQGSVMWLMNNPQKQDVMVDGYNISVAPFGDNNYSAFGGSPFITTDTLAIKARQIKAVEKVSGCKVIDTERMDNLAAWKMKVDCHPVKLLPK